MAVLVTLLAVVLALLALLVAGLLRSHAEILRALHQLGVDLDPARDDTGAVTTAVGAPIVRSAEVPKRPSRRAADVVGTSPEHDAISIAVVGAKHLTLLAFLSSGCGSCLAFWDVFRDGGPVEIPGDARLVCVSKDAGEESVASIRRLAPTDIPTVMSSAAWNDYDVPVAPFFVLIDGASGDVIGEGAANEWGQVQSLLHTALDDAGMLDRKGNVKAGRVGKPRADALREARADRDLLAAGIGPGDPSLYTLPSADLPRPRNGCMTELAAHGIGVTLPTGWEGRVFRRPASGEVAASADDGPPAPDGETTHAIVHVATIALPPGMGDFASGAVDRLGPSDAIIVLFEYDPASAGEPLFRAEGIPQGLDADDFNPGVLQRAIRGQAGVQRFFHEGGRAFCLYVVLGAYSNRRQVVPEVNTVLATLAIDQVATPGTTPGTTTAPSTTVGATGTTTSSAPTTSSPSETTPSAP